MFFKEFKTTICTSKVAGPQKDMKTNTTSIISENTCCAKDHNTDLPSSTTSSHLHMKMVKVFTFIDDTYRELRRFSSGLYKDYCSTQLIRTINKYKSGCNKIIEKVLDSHDLSLRLSQNIVRTVDIFKELCICLTDLEEYQYRMCEIVSMFIVCELRLSVDASQQEKILITHRIIYIMRKHLVQEEEDQTLYNILRTLVSIPKLFNARDIMCAVFSEFIPIKPVPEVNVLPDKLYILYIIVFFRWMMMQNNDDDKLLIVNFAESFIKPSVSLCSNKLYGAYLPIYTMHSKATRTILTNLKCYRNIRNASIIDNSFKQISNIVNLCDDNEAEDIIVVDSFSTNNFAQIFASVSLEAVTRSFPSIKLEEKTIVGTVDLTDDEENLNNSSSVIERHDKWLNSFQLMAEQCRKSKLKLQTIQFYHQTSNNEKAAMICLDSDSEGEEEKNLAADNKKTTKTVTTKASSSLHNCNDLFADSNSLTSPPINCDTNKDSSKVNDEVDVTQIPSKFLSGTLRTYQAKKHSNNISSATENSQNKAHRSNSMHVPSTRSEKSENEEDEGTDMKDDQDILLDYVEAPSNTFLSPTKSSEEDLFTKHKNMNYNSSETDKVVFSQSLSRCPQQQNKTYLDNLDAKSPQKQKKRVQFNTSPSEPIALKLSKMPLKPALQQQKYTVSDAYENFYFRSFESFSPAPTIAELISPSASSSVSSSVKQQKQTNKKSNKNHKILKHKNIKNLTLQNNKSSNFKKNLPVLKQNSSHLKHKFMKNVKINLQNLRLDNISLRNFKTNSSKEQPHTSTIPIVKTNNSSNSKLLRPCELRTKTVSTSNTRNNNVIFRKRLPVIKKKLKPPKPLKIQKVLSLSKHDLHLKPNRVVKIKPIKEHDTLKATSSLERVKKKQVLKNDTETALATVDHDNGINDFSKISTILIKKINKLTCKIAKQVKETNDLQVHKELPHEHIATELEVTKNKSQRVSQKRSALEAEAVNQKEFVTNQNGKIKLAPEKEKVTKSVIDEKAKEINNSATGTYIQSSENETNLNILEQDKVGEESASTSAAVENNNYQIETLESYGLCNNKGITLNLNGTVKTTTNNIQEKVEMSKVSFKTEHDDLLLSSTIRAKTELVVETKTKDGNIKKLTTDFSEADTVDQNCSDLKTDQQTEENSSRNIAYTFNKQVTNVCAEFLADLPNNTSPENRNYVSKEVEYEAKNTKLALRQLNTDEFESDKVLDNLNHKSGNTVDTLLNKKPYTVKEIPNILIEKKYISNENVELTKTVKTTGMETNKNVKKTDEEGTLFGKSSADSALVPVRVTNSTFIGNDTDNIQLKKANKKHKIINDVKEPLKLHNITKNNLTKTKMAIKEQIPLKKIKKSKHSKNNDKISKTTRNESDGRSSNYLFKMNAVDNCKAKKKVDNTTKDNITEAGEMSSSINENQHMTLELGNWKQNMENERKNSDSTTGGVSAIFSFPKIPTISISICTKPNNKTYFKISNRENNNSTKEDNGKIKKSKGHSVEKESEMQNEEKTVSSIMETQKLLTEPAEHFNEDDCEDVEVMEDMDIKKFSHDSNSACLPLKKRPTQAEPNEETNDSQLMSNSYEQPQDIAAEVVIENNDKDNLSMEYYQSVILKDSIKEKPGKMPQEQQVINKHISAQDIQVQNDEHILLSKDLDDNKPSTSAACFKKLSDTSSPFNIRVHKSTRSIGQPPVQIVTPQLKANSPPSSQQHHTIETQDSNVARMQTQNAQILPESYPATPMLSVANVEKLIDLNRFIEDLLASSAVMTIIDNANACGYYVNDQTYEMERIAILEHYNIANAKGTATVSKPLYWKKSAGDTISIFNDNDNEWIALPPSTANQLLKLSFVLSILQKQYNVSDVRQRINIALTFLIQTSYTSKINSSNSNSYSLQKHMQLYTPKISDTSTSSYNSEQFLSSTSYFRVAKNNEALNTNPTNVNETLQGVNSSNYLNNNQHQPELNLSYEPSDSNNPNWNNVMQFAGTSSGQIIEQKSYADNTLENEQQHAVDKRNVTWEELNNDPLYINSPCASSPQNEVIVNTNGIQLHEMPQNFQDHQNIFISITDESANDTSLQKYNTQQQQHQYLRTLEEVDPNSSTSSSYAKRTCLGNNATSNMQHNKIISTFSNQEINLQNPYRMQQQQKHSNQILNDNSNTSFLKRNNTSLHNLPISICDNNRNLAYLATQQQCTTTRYSTSFNTEIQETATSQETSGKANESNYKEILQPYITYLIKDHEKTSKHLLQVFEEVKNSTSPLKNYNFSQNLQQQEQKQQINSFLPPLVRNPLQNHMPGLHQLPNSSGGNILPSLIKNPQLDTITQKESGALQVVQSFLEQTEYAYDQAQQQSQSQTLSMPGFSKEYFKFVCSRDEIVQTEKLQNLNTEQQQKQTRQEQQLNNKIFQQDSKCLSSVNSSYRKGNKKLAENLKRNKVELSLLKHNLQMELLEKQQQKNCQQNQQQIINGVKNIFTQTKRRGRPKKEIKKLYINNNIAGTLSKNKLPKNPTSRVTRRNQANNVLATTYTSNSTDHVYSWQRNAAREAAKRINAVVNNKFP